MRCYNGCPDDELKSVWDERDRLRGLIERAGYKVTWFPMEEFYMGFDAKHHTVTGEHSSIYSVAHELGLA